MGLRSSRAGTLTRGGTRAPPLCQVSTQWEGSRHSQEEWAHQKPTSVLEAWAHPPSPACSLPDSSSCLECSTQLTSDHQPCSEPVSWSHCPPQTLPSLPPIRAFVLLRAACPSSQHQPVCSLDLFTAAAYVLLTFSGAETLHQRACLCLRLHHTHGHTALQKVGMEGWHKSLHPWMWGLRDKGRVFKLSGVCQSCLGLTILPGCLPLSALLYPSYPISVPFRMCQSNLPLAASCSGVEELVNAHFGAPGSQKWLQGHLFGDLLIILIGNAKKTLLTVISNYAKEQN